LKGPLLIRRLNNTNALTETNFIETCRNTYSVTDVMQISHEKSYRLINRIDSTMPENRSGHRSQRECHRSMIAIRGKPLPVIARSSIETRMSSCSVSALTVMIDFARAIDRCSKR